MMLGSKVFAPNLIHALLRISCSRKAKNTHNPLIFLRKMATYSCFAGHKVMKNHASMILMTF